MDRQQINEIIDCSVEAWYLFIQTGLESPFYAEARERIGSPEAAQITLFNTYLETFPDSCRGRLLDDVDYFMFYARGFIQELSPFSLAGKTDPPLARMISLATIRRLSCELKRTLGKQEHLDFLRAALFLSGSVDNITQTWDAYKEYKFRIHPQLHVSVA